MKNIALTIFLTSLIACAPVKPASLQATLTPEQAQKSMQDAGALKPEHALLNKFVGNWKAETKVWMDPAKSPEVSKGHATANLIYGGRFLQYSYKGKFMNQPFNGQGTMGYDNVSGKYFSTWIDSMSTMMMRSEGAAASNNSLVLSSAMVCPMTREHLDSEEVYTFMDKNNYKFEVFQNQNGQKFKAMEINYKRVK